MPAVIQKRLPPQFGYRASCAYGQYCNRSTTSRPHCLTHCLGHQKHFPEIGVDNCAPIAFGDVERGFLMNDTGIIDEDIGRQSIVQRPD